MAALTRKFLHVTILVAVDKMMTLPKVIPHWHLGMYEAKYGQDLEIVSRDFIEQTVELSDELARMAGMLGAHPETGQPYFDTAYGHGAVAARKVRDLIQSSPRPEDIVLAHDEDIELNDITLEADDEPAAPAADASPSGDSDTNGDPLEAAITGKGAKAGKSKD